MGSKSILMCARTILQPPVVGGCSRWVVPMCRKHGKELKWRPKPHHYVSSQLNGETQPENNKSVWRTKDDAN